MPAEITVAVRPEGPFSFVAINCNSVPFLSPSNDSRLNLELLLIDAGKLTGALNTTQTPDYPMMKDLVPLRVPFDMDSWQPREPGSGSATDSTGVNSTSGPGDYAQGEGSRCNTAAAGLEAFKNAVNAAGSVPKDDAASLIGVRSNLIVGCTAATSPYLTLPQSLHSVLAREFAAYIAGANAFYAGDFATALKDFDSLKDSTNPWLKETSRYMAGRTLLNNAQRSAFGEWGDLKLANVDKDSLKGAVDAFNSYLHDFPRGYMSFPHGDCCGECIGWAAIRRT
jgi:hypothetical protein